MIKIKANAETSYVTWGAMRRPGLRCPLRHGPRNPSLNWWAGWTRKIALRCHRNTNSEKTPCQPGVNRLDCRRSVSHGWYIRSGGSMGIEDVQKLIKEHEIASV